jgi:hypothetical protein
MIERLSYEQSNRLKRLKEWRASLGEAFCLDSSLLWPTPSLERLARAPDSLDVELASGNIRLWQRENFISSLKAVLKS